MRQEEYNRVRAKLLAGNGSNLIDLEKEITDAILNQLLARALDIKNDFDAAAELKPFWENYAPLQRGHKPRGDSLPWGEVGEKVLEGHLYAMLPRAFPSVRFIGLPYGPEIRGATDRAFIQIDVKSTGPNDNPDEVVSSPNQVTGDGLCDAKGRMVNSKVAVKGPRRTMEFLPELAPFYILGDSVLPTVTLYLKSVYSVRDLGDQPLDHLELICVPNGLLLFAGPKWASIVPKLLTPGKDEQHVVRKRTRIKLYPLASIAKWRCTQIKYDNGNVCLVQREPADDLFKR